MVGIDLNNIDKKEIIKFGANISFDEIGCARKATTLAHLFNIIDNRIKKERKESLVEGLVIHYLNESGLTTYPYLIFPKPRLAIFGPQENLLLTIPDYCITKFGFIILDIEIKDPKSTTPGICY
jgi:hypothetical protein